MQKLLVFVELYLNAYLQTDVQTGTLDNKDGQKFQANWDIVPSIYSNHILNQLQFCSLSDLIHVLSCHGQMDS